MQFADDTLILCKENSMFDLRISTLAKLEKVHKYLKENTFVHNVDETKHNVFGINS